MGMSNRTAIQWAIAEYVSDSSARSIELDVTAAALQLSTKFPQSGYTLNDICQMIEALSMRDGKASQGGRNGQKPSAAPER
jgi:hypothetical protein